MRLIPMLTAILVTVALYFAVFERDALTAFARNGAQAQPEQTAAADTATADAPVPDAQAQGPVIGVVVLRSEAAAIDSAVVLRGETRAARQVEVRAETSSPVVSEPLRKGVFVDKGDLLCELDPGTRQATLAQSKAALAEAQARVPEAQARLDEAYAKLEEAQINFRARDKLIEGGYASETQLIAARAEVQSATAGIESAKAGLEATASGIEAAQANVAVAEREIDRLTIEAPFAGLLESDTAELGSLMQPGSLCATIVQLNPIKVVGYVPETQVSRVSVGAMAGAELATGERVQGQVTYISRSADMMTRTFEVEITVPNDDLRVRDGQTAAIAISAAGTKAHRLPASALTLNNDGKLGVRTVDDINIVRFVPVGLLRDTVDGVWVSGLEDKANVIVVGQEFVTDGVTVRPTFREIAQ
ncbi:efflux RND transporter periplasmic adaptor subunit [Seohaeicola saemankumensis]|nr:efflux RND transporter periplasmic adaptor subunit [Seohaeicola saemankumensis]MCA0872349.1 efflux RND transporter periplasmic adaptor subunit [Seohaeicola saemankumensis]